MRITAKEKLATRKRILDAAKALFRTKGFDQATTRDIARESGLATGTLFNYFATKEAIVVELATNSLEKAAAEFLRNRNSDASLAEDLFAWVAAQLRMMRPIRGYIRPFLETALTPATTTDDVASVQSDLSEQFSKILFDHGVEEPTSATINIFWALYVGVLTFWGNDRSPKVEDTLALLDQSIKMFTEWLP